MRFFQNFHGQIHKNQVLAAETSDFLPVKKPGQSQKSAREKLFVGVKKVKKAAKSGREKPKVPVKKSEKWPKMAFTPTFGFHAKKNTELKGLGRRLRLHL